MAPDDPTNLPGGARRLLLGPVDSFEKLEVLLALQEAAGSPLATGALATRAGVPSDRLPLALDELTAAGLVERLSDGMWRIASSADAEALAELAGAWATARPAVLKTLTNRAVARVRASAARVFADAFRLRPRRDEGEDDG